MSEDKINNAWLELINEHESLTGDDEWIFRLGVEQGRQSMRDDLKREIKAMVWVNGVDEMNGIIKLFDNIK